MQPTHQLGDHLFVSKGLYSHHGIYLGKNNQGQEEVIHYAGLSGDTSAQGSRIQITPLKNFAQGKTLRVRLHDAAAYQGQSVVERALSRLGENSYNLIFNNCEHFVNWCFEGISFSQQVNTAVAGSAASLVTQQAVRKTAQTALVSSLGAGVGTQAATLGAGSVMGSIAGSAGLGAVAGPVGLVVGALFGLVSWSLLK